MLKRIFVLLAIALPVLGYMLAPIVLEWWLEDFFAESTKSEVKIDDVDLLIFPLRARAEGLSIIERGEKVGVQAGLVTLSLDFWKLFQKKVELADFRLRQVKLGTDGKGGGLINLLNFMLEEKPVDNSRPWHGFITQGWVVSVPRIEIETLEEPSVFYDTGGGTLAASSVDVLIAIESAQTTIQLDSKALAFEKLSLGGLEGELSFREGAMFIESSQLRFKNSNTQVSGSMGLGEKGEYDLSIKSILNTDFLSGLAKELEFTAFTGEPSLELILAMSGKLAEPNVQGRVTAALPQFTSLTPSEGCAPKRLETKLSLDTKGVVLTELTLDDLVHMARLELSADTSFKAKLPIKINPSGEFAKTCYRQPELKKALFEIGGLEADIAINGQISPLDVEGQLRTVFPDTGTFQGAELVALFETKEKDLFVTAEENHPGDSLLAFGLKYSQEDQVVDLHKLSIRNYPARTLLARLSPFLPDSLLKSSLMVVTDQTRIDAEGGLKLGQTISGGLQFNANTLAIVEEPLNNVSGNIEFTPDGVNIGDIVAAFPGGNIEGTVQVGEESKSELSAVDLRLSEFHYWSTYFSGLEGRADLQFSMAGPDYELKTDVLLQEKPASRLLVKGDADEVRLEELVLLGKEASSSKNSLVNYRFDSGKLAFNSLEISSNAYSLHIDGAANLNKDWNLFLKSNLQLGVFSEYLTPLEHIAGSLRAELKLTGPFNAPEAFGQIELGNGSVSVPLGGSVVGVEEIDALILLENQDLQIDHFGGRMGAGALHLTGNAENLFDEPTRNIIVNLGIEDGLIEPFDGLSVNFASELQLSLQRQNAPKLEGKVSINEAQYEKFLDLATVLRDLSDYIVGRSVAVPVTKEKVETEKPLDLNIEVSAPGELLIATNIANLELATSLLIQGTTERPLLQGDIQAIDGTFGLSAEQFELLSGKISFAKDSGTLDPKLAILGETTVSTLDEGAQTARINIAGTLTEPDVSFSSDSGLSEREIAKLVSTGGGGFSLLRVSEDKYRLIDFFDPNSDLTFQERIVGITGFENIEIDSTFSSATGDFTPIVRGKRPISSGLSLNVESELAGEQTNDLSLDYPLQEDLDLIVGWRSRTLTDDVNSSRGQYRFGFSYKRPFQGQGLLPQ